MPFGRICSVTLAENIPANNTTRKPGGRILREDGCGDISFDADDFAGEFGPAVRATRVQFDSTLDATGLHATNVRPV